MLNHRLFLCVLLVGGLASCNQKAHIEAEKEASGEPDSSSVPQSAASDEQGSTAPEKSPQTGASSPEARPAAATWQQALQSASPAEREALNSLNTRYYGSLAYDSPQQLNELSKLGFPSPNQWREAASQSTEALRRGHENHDYTAGVLYVDRLINEASRYRSLKDQDRSAYENGRGAQLASDAYLAAGDVMRATPNAFTAYQYAAVNQILLPEAGPEVVAGALLAAYALGDERAKQKYDTYVRLHPNMDSRIIMRTYRGFGLSD